MTGKGEEMQLLFLYSVPLLMERNYIVLFFFVKLRYTYTIQTSVLDEFKIK